MDTVTDVVVRDALPHEVAQVGALTRRAYLQDGLVGPSNPYATLLADAASRARDAALIVAVDARSEALLGTVTFTTAGRAYAEISRDGEAEFRMLAVAPEARGRGVGEALVTECLARARQIGARRVVISTSTAMAAAGRLYDRMGFVRLPERDWSPVPGVALIAYRREV